MTAPHSALAPEHLPFFITPPGGTDVLFNIVAVFVLLCVVGLGVVFFTIHALPERIAHRTKKVQLDIVAVLVLLSLFTNEHIFWIAALLLAFIDLPDFLGPVLRIATAVENIAAEKVEIVPAEGQAGTEPVSPPLEPDRAATAQPSSNKPELAEASRQIQKGPAHA